MFLLPFGDYDNLLHKNEYTHTWLAIELYISQQQLDWKVIRFKSHGGVNMQGFMVQNNLKNTPYGIAIIDTDRNHPSKISKNQYWEIIKKGAAFPAYGYTVTKAIDVVGNVATLNIAEIDKEKKEYSLFNSITVSDRRIKYGYPLQIYAEYNDTSSILIRVYSGRNGKKFGEYNLAIQRPEYKPPVSRTQPQRQPQRAHVTSSTQVSQAEKERIQREKEERERIIQEEARKKLIQDEEIKKTVQRRETLEKSLDQLYSMVGLDFVKEAVSMLVSRIEYEINREEELRKGE